MRFKPLVSIVIPCYNHARFVQETIKSVIDQDYENIELIIIDDGSKDNSVEVIQEMIPACEERFKRFEFRHRPNKGLCATLNEAIEWCQGKYYSAIASDDFLLPRKTTLQVQYLNSNPSVLGVFGGIIRMYSDGRQMKCGPDTMRHYDFRDVFLHKHFLPAPTQMIRLSAIKSIKYRTDIYIEDWYMWLELSKFSDLAYLPDIMAVYRRHENNMSNQIEKMSEGRRFIVELHADDALFPLAVMYERICTANAYLGVENCRSWRLYLSSNLFFTTESVKYLIKLVLNIVGLRRG